MLENGSVIANKLLLDGEDESNMKSTRWNFSNYNEVVAKKIKIQVPNYGIIPEGKQGAGHKAWTFIDEIIIN